MSDFTQLVNNHLQYLARRSGKEPKRLSRAAWEQMQSYNWPGNLRELERCVKRYMMVGDEELTLRRDGATSDGARAGDDLAQAGITDPIAPLPNQSRTGAAGSRSLRSIVQSVKAEAERSAIAMTLEKTGWNRKAAARLLKVSYRTVLYKIEHYKITASKSSALQMATAPGLAETGSSTRGLSGLLRRE